MVDISSIIEVASQAARRHKEHSQLKVEVSQRKDPIGIAALVKFRAPMPPGATAVASLTSGWGFAVGSCDGQLFRDLCGDFQTLAPVIDQVAGLYIPYGVTRQRKAGLYTMDISVVLADPSGGGDSLGHAEIKIALPRPTPWHKIDYLWPFIGLCMTIVRADKKVKSPEIRGLKALLTAEFGLEAEDMKGLHLAMKTPSHSNRLTLLRSVRRRMPYLSPPDLIGTLLRVACYDGPLNRMEHTALRELAVHAGLDDRTWGMLVERHAKGP